MPAARQWRFAPFELDLGQQRLTRDGQPLALTPKALALLALLLQRAGQLVTKEEVFASVWTDRVVSDAALARVLHELRQALGDDAAQPRFVQTAHGQGLRFVAAVDSDRLAPVAPNAAGAEVVGRQVELQALQRALDLAAQGQRRLLLVAGEAGLGKTTLVAQALAQAPGWWLGTGRCIQQYGTEEAYLPMLEALEQLAAQVGNASLREHLLRYAPGWLAQLPWLAHDLAPGDLARALHGGSPARLLREFAQALEVLSRRQPLVLWLEDLHWSDRSSLDVLAFLAGRREPARLLVVVTLRPPRDTPATEALTTLLGRLASLDGAQRIDLAPLPDEQIAALVAACLPEPGQAVDPALVTQVQQRSEGNPLFARAIAYDLQRGDRLTRGPRGWMLRPQARNERPSLPEGLRPLVRSQLASLGADDHLLAQAAAVAGSNFDAALVAAALELPTDDVTDRCATLCGPGGLLRAAPSQTWPDGGHGAGFAFVHALYQDAVLDAVPQGRRAVWQRRMAERLARAHADDLRPVAAELALRWQEAHAPRECLQMLRLAAETALVCFAYPEGVRLLRRALEVLADLSAADRRNQEPGLLLSLGPALIATQGYAAQDVRDVYQRALSLSREPSSGADPDRALRGLWNVALVRADLVQAQSLADELMQRAHQHGDAESRFDAEAKCGQTAMHLGRFAAARQHLESALQALPEQALAREAPRVEGYLSWVLWHIGCADQALAAGERALALARQVPSPHSLAFALGFVAWLHAFRGEWPQAQALALQQGQVSLDHGMAYWHAWSEQLLGLGQAQAGHADAGLARSEAALAAYAATGAEVGLAHFHAAHAQACLAAGRLDAARHALQRADRLVQVNGNAYHAAELLRLRGQLAQAGDQDSARAWFAQALALAQQQGAHALALRALASLASLDHDSQALARLRIARAAFAEGQETADLRWADQLLDA